MSVPFEELSRRLANADAAAEAEALAWLLRHAEGEGWISPQVHAQGAAMLAAGARLDAAAALMPAGERHWRMGNSLDAVGWGNPWAAVGSWRIGRGNTPGLALAAGIVNARGEVPWALPFERRRGA